MPYVRRSTARRPSFRSRRTARGRIRRTTRARRLRTFKKRFSRPASVAPFAMTKFCCLRYTDYQVLTSNDTWQTYTYRLNSLYDPNFTGGGGQPRFFTTLCNANGTTAPYYKYRVHGVKATVSFVNGNSSGNSIGIVAVRARPDSATVLNPTVPTGILQAVGEVPNTFYKWISTTGNDHAQCVFSKFWKMKKFYGVKDLSDSDELAAVYNASPTDIVKLDCHYSTVNSAGSSFNVQVVTKLKFYCEFFSRNQPTTS